MRTVKAYFLSQNGYGNDCIVTAVIIVLMTGCGASSLRVGGGEGILIAGRWEDLHCSSIWVEVGHPQCGSVGGTSLGGGGWILIGGGCGGGIKGTYEI